MGFKVKMHGYTTGRSLYGYIKKIDFAGDESDVWDENASGWVSGPSVPLASDAERITMTAGTGVEASKYEGETSANLDSYTGRVAVHVVDTSLTTDMVINTEEFEVRDGVEFNPATDFTSREYVNGLEKNKAQTVAIKVVSDYTGEPMPSGTPAGSTATPGASPSYSATTNTPTTSGIDGIWMLSLTAAETNVDSLLVQIAVTYSAPGEPNDLGRGKVLLTFGNRTVEDDLVDGGRLDTIFDAILADTDNIDTNLPTAASVADAVWDEAAAAHITAGSFGNLVERLDIVAAGGAGELTAARIAKLDNADTTVSSRATPAEVKTQADTALVDIHLDHLLAAAYDPASPPGNVEALLNELVESDAGVARFTANALEEGPTASGGATASAIADAVWDEAASGHTASGSFGEKMSGVTANLESKVDTIDTVVDVITVTVGTLATAASISALNDLSASDIDARLAAIGLDHLIAAAVTSGDVTDDSIFGKLVSTTGVWATFDEATDSLQAIRDRGDTAWPTGVTSVPSVTDIRTEMDSNSTQLAAIVADTNELQGDWADGGRLDSILDSRSSHTAVNVRTEMDTNSKLVAIEADTNELQTDWSDGGRLDLILDEIKTDGDTILVDTAAMDTTLKSGGEIHTMVNNISATPNTIGPEIVDDERVWQLSYDVDTSRNIVTLNQGDSAMLAADFSGVINPGTRIASANSFVVVEGDAVDITVGTPEVSQDGKRVQARVSGQLTGKRYKFKVAGTTTDSETISGKGFLTAG